MKSGFKLLDWLCTKTFLFIFFAIQINKQLSMQTCLKDLQEALRSFFISPPQSSLQPVRVHWQNWPKKLPSHLQTPQSQVPRSLNLNKSYIVIFGRLFDTLLCIDKFNYQNTEVTRSYLKYNLNLISGVHCNVYFLRDGCQRLVEDCSYVHLYNRDITLDINMLI